MTDRSLVQIAFYAAFIAVLGLVPKIDLGPVPITAQSLGIMLAGVMLGPWRGALACVLFLFVLALGAPVLSGGRGGIAWFYSASGGFLIGFPFAALAAGFIMQWTKKLNVLFSAGIAAFLGGIVALYAFGIPGMAFWGSFTLHTAAVYCLQFIPGDLIKVGLTAIIAQTIAKGLPSALISRA